MMILGLMVDIIVVVNEVGGGASLRQHWKRRCDNTGSVVSADDRLWASISDRVCMAGAYRLYCALRVLGARMMAIGRATVMVTRLRWWGLSISCGGR